MGYRVLLFFINEKILCSMVAGAGVGMFVSDTVSRDPVSVLVSEKFISLPSICCALGDGH
jgi:hypothetical protein